MTRGSIRKCAAALHNRYVKADRAGKRVILDESRCTTGYHPKAAIRLRRHPPKASRARRGRRKTYGPDVAQALSVAWEATDHICSKRLVPFLPELMPVLERHGELRLSSPLRALALSMSLGIADHLLAPYRPSWPSHPACYGRFAVLRSPLAP